MTMRVTMTEDHESQLRRAAFHWRLSGIACDSCRFLFAELDALREVASPSARVRHRAAMARAAKR